MKSRGRLVNQTFPLRLGLDGLGVSQTWDDIVSCDSIANDPANLLAHEGPIWANQGMEASPPDRTGQVLAERYQITGVLGSGAMGDVYEALDLLKVDRIDHGNSSMLDPALVKRLVDEQMALTVCPLSNTKLCVVDDMKHHPLPQMLEAGLNVTINSDDPAYFGGYLNENYEAISGILGNSAELLAQLARNSFSASFINDAQRDSLLAEVDAYMQQRNNQ